ncbi:MAG: hypothetical protein WCB10_12280 [Steroidobacteraceae bacterium]
MADQDITALAAFGLAHDLQDIPRRELAFGCAFNAPTRIGQLTLAGFSRGKQPDYRGNQQADDD